MLRLSFLVTPLVYGIVPSVRINGPMPPSIQPPDPLDCSLRGSPSRRHRNARKDNVPRRTSRDREIGRVNKIVRASPVAHSRRRSDVVRRTQEAPRRDPRFVDNADFFLGRQQEVFAPFATAVFRSLCCSNLITPVTPVLTSGSGCGPGTRRRREQGAE